MLDLRLLHQALMLARHRNFARAAQALRISQPALSRSIAGLETALGERLFDRTRHGIAPTAFGRMLLARAQPLVDGADELEREFRLLRGLEIGELNVAAGAYAAELSVSRAVGRLMARHPDLHVRLSSGDLRAIIDGVRAHAFDLAVIECSMAEGDPALAVEPLPEHVAFYFCRSAHPLAGMPDPSQEQVLAYPFVGTRMPRRTSGDFLQLAKGGRIDPDTGDYVPPIKVDTIAAAKDVVMRCDAIGAAPPVLIAAEVRAGLLRTLPLRADWLHTQYGFVHLRERRLSPAALAFMAEVREVESELSGVTESVAEAAGAAP